jgi:hypothetical protein
MAFRREVLAATGAFDFRLGRGSVGLSAEEILASRYPYGFGTGRVLRRARSPRLIANCGPRDPAREPGGAAQRREQAAARGLPPSGAEFSRDSLGIAEERNPAFGGVLGRSAPWAWRARR